MPGVSATACATGCSRRGGARAAVRRLGHTRRSPAARRRPRPTREFARTFAKAIGGDMSRAETRFGKREFVEGPLPVRVEQRTLVVQGARGDETVALTLRAGRIEVALGDETFSIAAPSVDRVRVDGGDGLDTLHGRRASGSSSKAAPATATRRPVTRPRRRRASSTRRRRDATVGDLSRRTSSRSTPTSSGATAYGVEDDDQISLGELRRCSAPRSCARQPAADRSPDGRRPRRRRHHQRLVGHDGLTLDGGAGDNVLLGGPGNDHLLGGPGFDDARGGKGADVARLGGDFDRFSWKRGRRQRRRRRRRQPRLALVPGRTTPRRSRCSPTATGCG